MENVSVVIVAKDNPPHLFETLNSLKDFVSEIIIVDIGLKEDLRNKLKENSINQLIEHKNNVPYVEVIREKTKEYAKNDWVLFLDPDEVVTADLKELIKKEIKNCDYFKIPRKNIIFDKWIGHSRWWPDYQIRLFKKDKVVWPTQIHGQPQAAGRAFIVPAQEKYALIHYNYENLDEFFEKYIRYAKAEANPNPNLKETINKAVSEFISRYFANDGFKDGTHGFALAFMQMFYYFLVYFYSWEKRKYSQTDEKALPLQAKLFFKQSLLETNYWLVKKKLASPVNRLKEKITNLLLK